MHELLGGVVLEEAWGVGRELSDVKLGFLDVDEKGHILGSVEMKVLILSVGTEFEIAVHQLALDEPKQLLVEED